MDTPTTIVFLAVVGGRFVLPLFIPRWPLPAIIACLVLDGYDQTIFQAFGYDPPGYQSYDKAMDVFYLAVAYVSTLRNWTNVSAYGVGRALYFYRLVGVVAFEVSQWRALLLVFANTFEYYFIAYEAQRLRWNPLRWGLKWWIGVAAFIWVVVKLPQEWWIHIAQRDPLPLDALTRDRIEWARRRGLKSLYLLTMTAGDYWPRFGFARADRSIAPHDMQKSPEFTDACPSSALFMALSLQQESSQ